MHFVPVFKSESNNFSSRTTVLLQCSISIAYATLPNEISQLHLSASSDISAINGDVPRANTLFFATLLLIHVAALGFAN